MKKSRILVLLISICTFSIQAQEAKQWTLAECIQHALDNNISIQQSELDVELSEIDKLTAIGNFIPTLNMSAGLTENTGLSFNPVTNNAQTTTFLSATGRINVGYTLFDGLANYRRVQRADLSKLAADYRLDKIKDDIALFVANGYLQVLTNKANLESATAQNLVTIEQIERTNQLVDAGELPRGDLLEIEASNASELQNIAVLENAVVISRISLAQLLLIDDYKNFDVVDEGYDIIDTEISEKSVEELIAAAKENRNEVKIAQANMDLAEKDLQIAKAAYWPTLSAFFGYDTRYTDGTSFVQSLDADNPVSVEQIGVVENTGQAVIGEIPNTVNRLVGPDPFFDQIYQNDGISYGLQLNIPIFNGFQVKSNVKRNKINLQRTEFLLEQAELDLESNVYQAFVDAKGSLKAYEAAQKAIESQELAYEYAKERYDVGLTNAFDFSQSKLRYDNAVIALNRSKYDYIFKIKVLELYFGIPVTELKF
ncbi:transporter [Patiriisocius marinistellae]|uniref:Transporter n=1 Tax=Patiriisocius marinistellae TaxID=2494560 RepID=A0A5J4FU76_9FLAO|nr:TolC family protein [Patiriisocius marinistellae]GEQ85293.1 transporter [Patiriisocius marinistellae]